MRNIPIADKHSVNCTRIVYRMEPILNWHRSEWDYIFVFFYSLYCFFINLGIIDDKQHLNELIIVAWSACSSVVLYRSLQSLLFMHCSVPFHAVIQGAIQSVPDSFLSSTSPICLFYYLGINPAHMCHQYGNIFLKHESNRLFWGVWLTFVRPWRYCPSTGRISPNLAINSSSYPSTSRYRYSALL